MKSFFPLPRLRTLLLLTNLMILLLPVGGIYLLHLYESELVRRTESALIGQGALLAATFHQQLISLSSSENLVLTGQQCVDCPPTDKEFALLSAQLDVASEPIHPSAPEAKAPGQPPDPMALAAGRILEPIIKDAKQVTLAGVRLVDHQGIVVASSGSEAGLSLLNRLEVQQMLRGSYVSLLRERIPDEPAPPLASISRRAWVRVFVALPVIEGDKVVGGVILSRSPLGVSQSLYQIRTHLVKGGAALLLLVLVVSLLTTIIISRPIRALVRQTEKIGRGEHDGARPLDYPCTREVAQLSNSFAEMATSLRSRTEYIETFARNVSHEFKTPLTSLSGAVELLQDHGNSMTDQERQRFLENMAIDIKGLDLMVTRLHELARADVSRQGSATCTVSQVVERLTHRYREQVQQVGISTENGLSKMHIEADTLVSIIANLIDNSLQHGGPQVSVKVDVQSGADNNIEWLVRDNGSGISKANAKKIFRPFFTTNRHNGGTGLGLAIVQSLLKAHDGSVELMPSPQGAVFKVLVSKIHQQQMRSE
ncbi:MAG: HAMP domain-containing sensor histidine kinase [Thermodesulfobacteriota bacterium]